LASPPFSEGGVVFVLSLPETAPVGLDELQSIGDELVCALGDALVGLPDMAIQGPYNSYLCPLVEAPCSDVGQFLEANDPDPAGLFLGRVKGDVERCHRIPLRTVENFGVRPKVACENALVEHGDSSPFWTNFGQFKNILEFSMIYIYRITRYPGIGGRKGWQRKISSLFSRDCCRQTPTWNFYFNLMKLI